MRDNAFFVRPTFVQCYICPMWDLSKVRFAQCGRLSNGAFVWCYICPMWTFVQWGRLFDVTFVWTTFVWRDICLPTFVQLNLSNWCVFNETFVWYDACLTYICLTYVCPIWLLSNVTFVQCDFCPNNVCPVCPKQLLWDWCLSDLRLSNVTCDKCVYSSNSSNTSGEKRDKQDKQWVILNGNTDIVITQLMPPNSSRLTSPKLFI